MLYRDSVQDYKGVWDYQAFGGHMDSSIGVKMGIIEGMGLDRETLPQLESQMEKNTETTILLRV